MKKVTKDIVRCEFIGKKAKVVNSKNKNMKIEGTIIDETKNMFIIREGDKKKKVTKKGNTFEIIIKTNKVRINGDLLLARPEERIKMKVGK